MAEIRDGKFAPLRIKLAWTAFFLVCFVVGRLIPVPLVHDATSAASGPNSGLLNAASIVTGGAFFSSSLFALGLGPWMGAAILWRFLFIGQLARDRKIPEETVTRARNAVMVVLAILQAIGLSARYELDPLPWGPLAAQVNAQVVVVVVLTAGAILVAWLAHKNEDLGLGGITMFILYQIVFSVVGNVGVLSEAMANPDDFLALAVVAVACLCVLVAGIATGNSELRLHVNKVAIDNGYTGTSYLPLKLNPAGASPIMYALTLLVLPQFVAHAIAAVVPGASGGVERFVAVWGLSSPVGFTVYLVLLFGLTLFFGLFTVGPKQVAERMQKAGEYFDRVAPGPDTRRYVRGKVLGLSALSGLFLVVVTGLPLYFMGRFPHLQWVLMAPGTLLIVLGLVWMLKEEVADTMIGRKYSFSFTSPARGGTA